MELLQVRVMLCDLSCHLNKEYSRGQTTGFSDVPFHVKNTIKRFSREKEHVVCPSEHSLSLISFLLFTYFSNIPIYI